MASQTRNPRRPEVRIGRLLVSFGGNSYSSGGTAIACFHAENRLAPFGGAQRRPLPPTGHDGRRAAAARTAAGGSPHDFLPRRRHRHAADPQAASRVGCGVGVEREVPPWLVAGVGLVLLVLTIFPALLTGISRRSGSRCRRTSVLRGDRVS